MKMSGKIPSGEDLLRTLVNLLADQEGVKIDFEVYTERGTDDDKEKSA